MDGKHMHQATLRLRLPGDLEPKLERQMREYACLMEIGEQLAQAGLLDPAKLC